MRQSTNPVFALAGLCLMLAGCAGGRVDDGVRVTEDKDFSAQVSAANLGSAKVDPLTLERLVEHYFQAAASGNVADTKAFRKLGGSTGMADETVIQAFQGHGKLSGIEYAHFEPMQGDEYAFWGNLTFSDNQSHPFLARTTIDAYRGTERYSDPDHPTISQIDLNVTEGMYL